MTQKLAFNDIRKSVYFKILFFIFSGILCLNFSFMISEYMIKYLDCVVFITTFVYIFGTQNQKGYVSNKQQGIQGKPEDVF